MKTTLAAILAMLVGGLIGCSSTDDDAQMYEGDIPQTRGSTHDDATRLQSDPVCGRTVNPNTSVSETYDEVTFYFTDEECREKFRENPQAYFPARDPVCGMTVDPKTSMYTEEYDNKRYYFDTKECAQKFKDNPHAYLPGGDDRPGIREVK
jgi:P-type Cu+ transporter